MTKQAGAQAYLSDDARYRMFVEAVADYAIYMLDADGIVASWNAGAERFKGYRAEEIIGQHFSRFYPLEDQAAGRPALSLATAEREGRFESEGWRVKKDGSRFWAHVVLDPIRDPDGRLVGFAKITRDLTERRAAEQTLQRSQEQFRLLVQSVTDYALYMLSPTGHVTNWNAGAERIKGYEPDEIIGEHFSRFYIDEDRAAGMPARALETARREGRFEAEGWRRRKDGTHFWASVVIDPIRDDAGEIIGFAKITRDITERREAQQALERTREALFQSQKMEAIGQLTGGVAHDFNNLLMAVLGSLELVKRRIPPDPRVHALLDNAIEGAQRGATLTQRMLAFARRQEIKAEAVSLGELVPSLTELLSHSIGPAVQIRIEVPKTLPPVLADSNQIEMALLNLTVNARDAMPLGGRLDISAEMQVVGPRHATLLPPGRYVRLSVRDTGSGMDEATLARAVEPFFTTKGPGKGTGLGLSMVHGIAEQSHGRLVVTSRPGEGTVASIYLPVSSVDRTAFARPAAGGQTPGATQSFDILAVDDDALVLRNTMAMLSELGHRVAGATSAKEALGLLETTPRIDLVLSDHAMPDMTGLDLAATLRRSHPNLPVLLTTGYADALPGPTSDVPVLQKPFLLADLEAAITRLVAHRPAA